MISRGARVVCHGVVTVTLVKEVILGKIDATDLHVPEDLQPAQRPALLSDVAAQWRWWAEQACPHTLHVAFPTEVSFQGNIRQNLFPLLGALHVCGTMLPHSHVGSKRVVETEATAPQLESLTLRVPTAQPLRAQTWAVPLFGALQTDPQNNCATDFPIHPTVVAFSQTHSPIDVSTARVSLSHALSSNDHTGIHECHAHHTEGRVEGWHSDSDHTAYYQEAGRALPQHQRPSTAMSASLCLELSHLSLGHPCVLLNQSVQKYFEQGFVCEPDEHAHCADAARDGTLDLQGHRDRQ